MAKSVVIDGVTYVPICEANPNAEQIARALMQQFWGEIPHDKDWKTEAAELFVHVDEGQYGNPSVMDVVGIILERMASK
jgi:hypothetical protein